MNTVLASSDNPHKYQGPRSREDALNVFVSFALWLGKNPCHTESFPYLQHIHGMLDSAVYWNVEVLHPNTAAVLTGNLSPSAWEVTNIGDYLSPDMIAMYNLLKENLNKVQVDTHKQVTPWLKVAPPSTPPFYYNFLARFASDVVSSASRANGATGAPDMGIYLSFYHNCDYNGKRQLLKIVFALGDHSVSISLPHGEVHHAHLSAVTGNRGPITSFDIRVGAKVVVFGRPITLGQVADNATLSYLATRAGRLLRARQTLANELRKYTPQHVRADNQPQATDLHALSRLDARALVGEVEALKQRLRALRPDVVARLEQAMQREEEKQGESRGK